MIRREITWRSIEDFIIKKCWSVSTLVPCLNPLPLELQWPIFLPNRVPWAKCWSLAFIIFPVFAHATSGIAAFAHANSQLAQAKHDLAQKLAHANMYLAHAKSSEWLQLSQSHPRAREAGSRASEWASASFNHFVDFFSPFWPLACISSNLSKPSIPTLVAYFYLQKPLKVLETNLDLEERWDIITTPNLSRSFSSRNTFIKRKITKFWQPS